jgi:hypothetical protein
MRVTVRIRAKKVTSLTTALVQYDFVFDIAKRHRAVSATAL